MEKTLSSIGDLHRSPKIGVMGSAQRAITGRGEELFASLAERLGQVIADRGCVLVTGATTGVPDLVSRSVRRHGGLSIGISPAFSKEEHVSRYSLPEDGVDVLIYTGFGLKGRNVINIRSSDIVIIFGGGIGTLNEFTIAYDEDKIIGVLEGTGGVTEQIQEIVKLSRKRDRVELVFSDDPETLVDACLRLWSRSV
ncbi:MAG: hypothetical protein WAV20_25710 [Blastocatellia bacterium]